MVNRMKLYLTTGFLGAGKTTFLKNFLRLFEKQKLYLIINEFGREGVDGTLLREMNTYMAEINNGSIFCACRLDKFEEELRAIIKNHADTEVIIVEASGLSDPTNVRSVLQASAFQTIEYCGSVCLLDAARFQKVKSTARVVPKQIQVSSLGLINKTDLVQKQQIEELKQDVLAMNPAMHLECTQFGAVQADWLRYITPQLNMEQALTKRDITLQKATLHINENMSVQTLKACLQMIAEDTYRIKGFVRLQGSVYLVDCVGSYLQVGPYAGDTCNENALVVLAGVGMSLRKALKTAQEWYPNDIETVVF